MLVQIEPGITVKTPQVEDFKQSDRMERANGIEPSALAWEARVLPLYDARSGRFGLQPDLYRYQPIPIIDLSGGIHDYNCTR